MTLPMPPVDAKPVSSSCAGACCSVFPLPEGWPYAAMKRGFLGDEWTFIADMLIPLTRRQALARSRRLGYPDPPKYGKGYNLWTCRHWDEETRLCGVYDQRPRMCSDYPYGSPCERGCGYETGKPRGGASSWVWDEAAKGWYPKDTTNWVWDRERGVMRTRELEQT